MKPNDGDFRDLTGAIFASWFTFNPNGPTVCAVGFVETADMPWSLFFSRMHPIGAKTFLGAAIDDEISAAWGNFFDVFFNLMVGLNNYLAMNNPDTLFSDGAPTFIRTNGNPAVDAAMRWLIANSPSLRGNPWGRDLYLREVYGAPSVGSNGEQFHVVYEKHKKQHPPMGSEALFARWWATVTDKAYVQPSTLQFAQAWIRAAHVGKGDGPRNRDAQRGRMSYSELARFFDNFHMPMLPPEIDEKFLLKSAGLP